MSKNRKLLRKANLYLILDTNVLSYTQLLGKLDVAVRAGVDIVQLRDKTGKACDILEFSKEAKRRIAKKALYIMNDRIDLAILSGADGVHLGQEDIPYNQARQLMGSKAIIGVSCQTKEQVKKAQRLGVDYIGFGSVFKTKTKPDRQPMNLGLLKAVAQLKKVPTFAIGGIDSQNVRKLTDLGVERVAVCRDILLAGNVGKVVKDFKDSLKISE